MSWSIFKLPIVNWTNSYSVLQILLFALPIIVALPHTLMRLLRSRLVCVFAQPHIDYVLQLAHYISAANTRLLGIAHRKILRKALGLHSRCAGALVAAVAGIHTFHVRVGQLCILRTHQQRFADSDLVTARVVSLRRSGTHSHSAARQVFRDNLCTAQWSCHSRHLHQSSAASSRSL